MYAFLVRSHGDFACDMTDFLVLVSLGVGMATDSGSLLTGSRVIFISAWPPVTSELKCKAELVAPRETVEVHQLDQEWTSTWRSLSVEPMITHDDP